MLVATLHLIVCVSDCKTQHIPYRISSPTGEKEGKRTVLRDHVVPVVEQIISEQRVS